jgi:hypothetical protein
MKTVLTLAMVAAILAPGSAAFGQSVSREAERFLEGVHFTRPPSNPEKRKLMAALRRRGIMTLTDLRPFLTRSERVRHNALIAIDSFPRIDDRTLGLVEELARDTRDSPAMSVAAAVRLVLERRPHPAAAEFALDIAPRSHFGALREIMTWLATGPQLAFATTPDARPLIQASLTGLTNLFERGTYSGEWLISFSLLMARPPFDDPAHTEAAAPAFLTALRNAGRMHDLREIGLVSAFAVVMPAATHAPQLVEAGLIHIMTSSPGPLVKLLLWRMSVDGFDRTPSGQRVLATTLRSLPALTTFVGQLQAARHDDREARRAVKQDIAQALEQLPPPEQGLTGLRTASR